MSKRAIVYPPGTKYPPGLFGSKGLNPITESPKDRKTKEGNKRDTEIRRIFRERVKEIQRERKIYIIGDQAICEIYQLVLEEGLLSELNYLSEATIKNQIKDVLEKNKLNVAPMKRVPAPVQKSVEYDDEQR